MFYFIFDHSPSFFALFLWHFLLKCFSNVLLSPLRRVLCARCICPALPAFTTPNPWKSPIGSRQHRPAQSVTDGRTTWENSDNLLSGWHSLSLFTFFSACAFHANQKLALVHRRFSLFGERIRHSVLVSAFLPIHVINIVPNVLFIS